MAYTLLDMAAEILKSSQTPLTYQEIWERSVNASLDKKVKITGKTPWASLGSVLYVEVRDNPDSVFLKISSRPARFWLKTNKPLDPASKISADHLLDSAKSSGKPAYLERQLHPLLAYFAYANLGFNRGRAILTKTIYHENSKKRGYNEWVHPDMVGFYLPLEDWRPEVIEFNRLCDNNSIRLYSFELKRTLDKATYRESFFQAVSNSSWAHEGYLVAADILQDDDFLAELERLAASFGIGIIRLDLEDIDSSGVLFPARTRSALDWETINKLCEQNPDFQRFIQDVKIDFESKRIHNSEYDPVNRDIRSYIQTLKTPHKSV